MSTVSLIISALRDVVLARYLSGVRIHSGFLRCAAADESRGADDLEVEVVGPKVSVLLHTNIDDPVVTPQFLSAVGLPACARQKGLFTLRLVALYKHRPLLVWFMRIFFVGTYASTLAAIVIAIMKYREHADYFAFVNICGTTESHSSFPAMFYAPSAYEFIIFALTAYRAYRDASIITNSSSAPFLVVLYRDGMVCFLVMVAIRSWNIWIYLTQPISALNIGVNIFWAINTILSTRVYLNLVWLVRRPVITANGETGYTTGMRTGPNVMFRGNMRGALTSFAGDGLEATVPGTISGTASGSGKPSATLATTLTTTSAGIGTHADEEIGDLEWEWDTKPDPRLDLEVKEPELESYPLEGRR